MSVIVTGMDMPKYCGSCDMSGTGVCRKWMCLTSFEIGKKRAEDCSLKSIDGLIEKVEQLKKSCANDSYGKCMANAISNVEKLIKEYCEVEDAGSDSDK